MEPVMTAAGGALADFASDLPGQLLVARAAHQTQRFLEFFLRKNFQERRLA